MCRNIKVLFNFEPPATSAEIRAAAEQYVRKISGFTKPSQINGAAFEAAVVNIAAASEKLLNELTTRAPTKDREQVAAQAMRRSRARFG